jgi:release factor glutamine methyltransferase
MLVRDALTSAGIEAIDAEVLLAAVLQKDRTWSFAHPDDNLDDMHIGEFREFAARRRAGEPIAYILGEKEFYGRTFRVNPSVLIPRPATERLVELALHAMAGGRMPRTTQIDSGIVAWHHSKESSWSEIRCVADIGTGSGCIAVSMACEEPDMHIIATDISERALHIAEENARLHGVLEQIDFRTGCTLHPLEHNEHPYVLISNPPYIPENTVLEKDVVDFEPHTALFSGPDGTDILSHIISSAHCDPLCRGWMVECREEQAQRLSRLYPQCNFERSVR